ncbi:MAG: DUF5317 family protein [Eubacterium sp.]
MFVILAIIIGLIIGFIRGGKFKGFKAKKITLLPLGLIGIFLQIILHLYFYTGGISAIDPFLPVVNFISYILILVMFVFNLDDFWTIMMSVGLTSNFIVAFINGGKMPIAANVIDAVSGTSFGISVTDGVNAVYSIIEPSTTSLWFLGVNVPIPFIGKIMAYLGSSGGLSVGGIVVFIGIIGFVQYAMNRIPADSIFNKNAPIGEEDYILPPDKTEEDFFSDEDDDADENFYSKSDFETDPVQTVEDSFGGKTGRISKLTPETISKIQKSGKQETIGVSVLEEYDSSQDTKVFTAINDLGIHSSSEQEDENKDDMGTVSGFFTQSFYAEKEKGKLAFEKEQVEKLEEVKPIVQEKEIENKKEIEKEPEEKILEQRIIIEEPVPDLEEQVSEPVHIEEETPFVVENDKIVSNPAFENTMTEMKKTERSENDMLNIWQKVNQENERVRAKKRRNSRYVNTKEPFKAEREREAAAKAVERATKVAKARATASPQPLVVEPISVQPSPSIVDIQSQTKVISKPISTEVQTHQDTVAFNSPNLDQTAAPIQTTPLIKENVEISDEEREKAGFERVSLNIEGRDVVFWRKKKD